MGVVRSKWWLVVGTVLVGLLVCLTWVLGKGGFQTRSAELAVDPHHESVTPTPPARNEADLEPGTAATSADTVATDTQQVIEQWYAPLWPLTIGDTAFLASIADTPEARMQGLSGTPFLPPGIAKLFVFETTDTWGFWMKDMNYAIDIIWVSSEQTVVHIEGGVSPDTYPKSFRPDSPAQYVIEVRSGVVAAEGISIGDSVILPTVP